MRYPALLNTLLEKLTNCFKGLELKESISGLRDSKTPFLPIAILIFISFKFHPQELALSYALLLLGRAPILAIHLLPRLP